MVKQGMLQTPSWPVHPCPQRIPFIVLKAVVVATLGHALAVVTWFKLAQRVLENFRQLGEGFNAGWCTSGECRFNAYERRCCVGALGEGTSQLLLHENPMP